MNARAAARTEWVDTRARELVSSGFVAADARSQAEREFDTADSVDYRTRGLATGELSRNERGELVDHRGRIVFAGDADDRRQRLDPDGPGQNQRESGGFDPAMLNDRYVPPGAHSHSSGRRRHKKPPKPDAVEMARSADTEESLRCSRLGRPPGRPPDRSEARSAFVGRIEPHVARQLREQTHLTPRDLLEEIHRLIVLAPSVPAAQSLLAYIGEQCGSVAAPEHLTPH